MYVRKDKKKKKIIKLHQEMAILQGDLAKFDQSRKEFGECLLEVKLLEEEHDNLHEAMDQREVELEEL